MATATCSTRAGATNQLSCHLVSSPLSLTSPAFVPPRREDGDDMTGTTTSLCVRRATYWCPELKADDPAKKGICSNFLCDAKPADELMLTGPSGKVHAPCAYGRCMCIWLIP